jgi:E3 ubiquitin-protein ligase UBR4
VIHQLEQVSSDEHVGSLAENTLEALRSHEKIWKEVEAARRLTREEKKRMAMAMRQRQLNAIGMKTNDKGQVTAAGSTILDQMEDLAEESGLICVICREGYKYQPTKVLGIYTFSKRCLVDDAETKSRKTYGYCTVSHFNVVHVDCHMAAIR